MMEQPTTLDCYCAAILTVIVIAILASACYHAVAIYDGAIATLTAVFGGKLVWGGEEA